MAFVFWNTGPKSSRRPFAGFGSTGRNSKQTVSITSGPIAVTKNAARQPQPSATSCEIRKDKPTPNERVEQRARPEACSKQAEQQGAERAHDRSCNQYFARIDAIGQRCQHRHGAHVTGGARTGEKSRLRAGQMPFRNQESGKSGWHDNMGKQASKLPHTDRGDNGSTLQRNSNHPLCA